MLISDFAKLNRLTQSSVFAALIVIAVVAMYKWIVTPHINCLFAAEQYDSAMDGVAQKNEDIVREIKVESKKLEKLSQQFVQSGDKLFTPDQVKEFFGALQAILEDAGCTVHSLNLVASKSRDKNKQPDSASGMVANSTMLSVSGGYNSIIRLVEGLQNHTPKVWVDSFEMEIVDFGAGRLKCDMTITIYTIQNKEAVLWINAGT
jgi:hypothetical protein